MKNVSKLAILVAAGVMLIGTGAQALDWDNWDRDDINAAEAASPFDIDNGMSVGFTTSRYVAVDANGDYVHKSQVNPDGSFKPTCVDCQWRPYTAAELAGDTVPTGIAKHYDPSIALNNGVTGDTLKLGTSGVALSNTDGSSTEVTSKGVTTNGTVSAKVLSTQDSAGNVYANVGDELSTHNGQIAALNNVTASQGAAINANTALLSQHSAILDEHSKGIAIAMALPDAWLGDKEKFAIAGNIGGFGDETAVGFAAIARLDQNWSLNAKFGSDTSFEEFGWTVGARAGF